MDIRITPQRLQGTTEAITSKSYAQRCLIAASLCTEPTTLYMHGLSEDINATIGAIERLGSRVTVVDNRVTVFPCERPPASSICCNESGTLSRIVLPIAAALLKEGTIEGNGSLLKRPFSALCNALRANGKQIDSDTLPISFSGKLNNGKYELPGNESSQYISGLLFALPLLNGSSQLFLTSSLQSRGYIDITLEVLKSFGIDIINNSYESFYIKGDSVYQSPHELTVEGDWSNAAFWLSAGIRVTGLKTPSAQRDSCFLSLLTDNRLDISEIPDLLPILAIKASQKSERTIFYNAERLRLKESNRLLSVCDMINALGGKASYTEDTLTVEGTNGLTGGTVFSKNDHRIVMAAAIAACCCKRDVTILNADAVNKSYPDFFTDYKKLGGIVNVIENR